MHGYRVTLTDGFEEFEAHSYRVDASGQLIVVTGEDSDRRYTDSEWVWVTDLGTPLSSAWPPDELEKVLQRIGSWLATIHGCFVHGLSETEAFESWQLNDLDAMADAILLRVDDGVHRQGGAEDRDIRALLASEFGIRI